MFYQIDREDRVVAVNTDWDNLAQASDGGERCSSEAIIGRPLLDFIAGDTTRMFVRAALHAVRLLGHSRSLPYRCDSPTERLSFDMVISPMADGQVRVDHVLVSRQPRHHSLNQLAQAGHVAAGWRCSQCLAVKPLGGHAWLPAEAVESGLLATDLCPSCAARLAAEPTPP